MTKDKLDQARELEYHISQYEQDLKDLDIVLKDIKNFGPTISFKRNSDGFSRSFGAKKYKIKSKLEEIIVQIKKDAEEKINKLRLEFEQL